jgi:hypothetical protein
MKFNKTILVSLLGLFCAAFLFGCGAAGGKLPASEAIGVWNLTVSNLLVTEDLLAEQSSVQYSGEAVQSKIQETPKEGNVFVLLTLTIEKQQAGAAAFVWNQLWIQDASGNKYARMENDSFLESYGYTRQNSTDLTLGKNEGSICFELPKQKASDKLMLCYKSDGTTTSIPLN